MKYRNLKITTLATVGSIIMLTLCLSTSYAVNPDSNSFLQTIKAYLGSAYQITGTAEHIHNCQTDAVKSAVDTRTVQVTDDQHTFQIQCYLFQYDDSYQAFYHAEYWENTLAPQTNNWLLWTGCQIPQRPAKYHIISYDNWIMIVALFPGTNQHTQAEIELTDAAVAQYFEVLQKIRLAISQLIESC